MEVKTEGGGSFDAAGKGTTGLSIAGLVTGAAGLLGSGILGMGNLRNWQNNSTLPAGINLGVSEEVVAAEKQIAALQAELGQVKSERYTDQTTTEVNNRIFQVRDETLQVVNSNVARIAALEQHNTELEKLVAANQEIMDLKLAAVKNEAASALALESERRFNGDVNLANWVKGAYVPGQLYMPSASITPAPMPQYNSWTAPTTDGAAKATATVQG